MTLFIQENLSEVGVEAGKKELVLSTVEEERVSGPAVEQVKAGEWDLARSRREAIEEDMAPGWSLYMYGEVGAGQGQGVPQLPRDEDMEVGMIPDDAVCPAVWKQLIGAMAECCCVIRGFILTPLKPQCKFLAAMAGGVTFAQLLYVEQPE